MDESEQKLDVIRKLLAKAERAATPDEADAYNLKAAELMARHGVDAAMIAARPDGGPREEVGSIRIAMTDPYSREKAALANGVAQAMGCRAIQHAGSGRSRTGAVTIMGFPSDLQRVELTYTSLLLQATRSVVRQRPPRMVTRVDGRVPRTYLIGFTNEVHRRLVAAERGAVEQHDATATTGSPSAAFVVADRRAVVDRAYHQQYGHLETRRRRRLSGTGYRAGVEAGRRADVGQRRVGDTRRAPRTRLNPSCPQVRDESSRSPAIGANLAS